MHNNGVVSFDNRQMNAKWIEYDNIRHLLANEILCTARVQVDDALSGRTTSGISSELYWHYKIFDFGGFFLYDNAKVADMGGTNKSKKGYDSNAWLFEF